MVNMKDKLETLAARYDEIQVRLSQPETLSDMDTWRRLMKEHADMEELMTAYGRYKTVLENVEQAKEMLEDPDLRDMAKEELSELEPEQEALERELQLLLLPKDPNDDRNVIVEIRAGTGGEEAGALCLGAGAHVHPLCRPHAAGRPKSWTQTSTELGGVKELSLMISGKGAYSRLKYESGVHRVQRVPETETRRAHPYLGSDGGRACPRRRTWRSRSTPTICVSIPTARAARADSTSTARTLPCALRTSPTGIVVQCQDERISDPEPRTGHAACFAPSCGIRPCRNDADEVFRFRAKARWAAATAPSASAPIISRRGA